MKNKTLAIFGIGTYILSVLSSATDLKGNSVVPIALIAISGIATIVFAIMAIVRLWKIKAKGSSITFALSEVSLFILLAVQVVTSPSYGNPIIILLNIAKAINFITFFWVISLIWATAKYEGFVKKTIKDIENKYGLTPEEISLVQKDLQKGNPREAFRRITSIQEQNRKKFEEAIGVDIKDVIVEIGREISWADIVNHVFRVLEFDRSDTTTEQNNQVKAKSSFRPYGYLLVESPIMNQKVKLPIIHRDDFLLAASVFDEPKLAGLVADEELLVTYSPKRLLPKGLSGSPHHALHYVITPRGTLNSYYSMNNDIHMAKPEPQKLFGSFVYQGEIKVQVNPEPKL
jgi:hypothetical protein